MRLLAIITALLLAIWLVPLLLSVESGLRFGWPYRVFFSFIVLFGGALFYLLRTQTMSPPKSTARAFGSVALVFFLSVGLIVLLANLAPQFAFEGSSAAVAATAQGRGKQLFNDPKVGCFLCHAVGGAGGTRGPDLSHVAVVAGNRRPGMSAEDYLRESVLNPGNYVVPTYDNIMPSFTGRLSPEALSDLIAYLNALR